MISAGIRVNFARKQFGKRRQEHEPKRVFYRYGIMPRPISTAVLPALFLSGAENAHVNQTCSVENSVVDDVSDRSLVCFLL